ncbi:MAG: DUF4349 domain-containing protein [Lutimonas sp.]
MKKILYLLLFAFLLASCNQGRSDSVGVQGDVVSIENRSMSTAGQELSAPSPPVDVENEVVNKKKIIKDGRLGIEVQDLEKAKTKVDSLVKKSGAYYANERLINTDYTTAYHLKIRVPDSQFENLISTLEMGEGEIKYKEIDARDVTEQFIDLETRLANKKSYLLKYRELLSQAKNVKDILEIETNIRAIEEEIESTYGRLKYLSDLVAYSTLDLELTKPKDKKYEIEKRDHFLTRIRFALVKGWIGFVDFIVFAVRIWPFWIIISLFIYFLIRFGKSLNRKKGD